MTRDQLTIILVIALVSVLIVTMRRWRARYKYFGSTKNVVRFSVCEMRHGGSHNFPVVPRGQTTTCRNCGAKWNPWE